MAVVLIVDDHAGVASTIADVVESAGADALVVHTGLAALQHLEANLVDLVILDEQMPGMTGIDVLRTLQVSARPAPPVVVLSASDRSRDDAIHFGATAALLKPDADGLVRMIEELSALIAEHTRDVVR